MLRIGMGVLGVTIAVASIVAAPLQQSQGPVYPLGSAPAELRPAVDRGMTLLAPLEREFLTDVTSALRDGGPAGAMKSCHLQPTIQELQIAREHGILVGRTSDRLRNPINAPRPWAAPIVAQYAGKKAPGLDGLVVDLGDHVGVMRPIVELAECTGCHGDRAKLSPNVIEALKDRYPADRAVGFEEGQIRGWFWAEVPKGNDK